MTTLSKVMQEVDEKIKSLRTEFAEPEQKSQFQALHKSEQNLRTLATEGNTKARAFVKNKIYLALAEMQDDVSSSNIDELIEQYHVCYYQNIYTGAKADSLLGAPVDKDIEKYFLKYSISRKDNFDTKLQKLSQILYQELYGYSVIDELVFDSDFNEVACNRYDYVWIQHKGIKRKIPNPTFKFISPEFYGKIVENRIIASAPKEMNAGEPIIYATLHNGFRVTAARPKLSRYPVVNIRRFVYKSIDKESRNKFMESKMLKIIEVCAKRGRRNIAIIGEMGAGKTTAADELVIKNLSDDLAIGLAENIHELNISGNYPNKNVIELQYSNNFKPSDITEIFFRLNRDIVVYGEIRNHLEAFEMVKAMLRQARGSLCTFHSSSAARTIHDLRQLLMQTGFYTDYREAQFDVADAIDIIIHIKLDRTTGKRYVHKISEVVADGHDMTFKVIDLFTFNKEKQKYLVNPQGFSKELLNSCMEYEMSREDVNYLKELFAVKDEDASSFEYMEEDLNAH